MSVPAQTTEATNSRTTLAGRRKIKIFAIVSGILAFLSFFIPNHEQRNMRIAQHHIDLIAPGIHADPRFSRVSLEPYYAGDGSVGVFGFVANDSDLAELKRAIDESKPPVKVFFQVFTDEEIEKLNQQTK